MNPPKPTSLFSGKRFYAVLFLFFYVVISYIDRVNLSIAGPTIAKHFHWDAAQMGWIFSAYLWTYDACLVPSGWLADRLGVRRVCAIAISIWSVAAMLTGAATNFTTMTLARLGLGVGEATTFPVSNKVIRQWIPAEERGFATGFYHSGSFMSIALTTPLVAWVVLHTGWRTSFIAFGALGFVWLIVWLRWFYAPEDCPWLPEAERRYIMETRDGTAAATKAPAAVSGDAVSPFRTLASQPSMWGLFLAQGCVNYTNYLFLAWLPSYMVQARGMNLMKAGIYTAIPYFLAGIMEVGLGKSSDRLLTPEAVRQGKRRNHVATLLVTSMVMLLVNVLNSEAAILAVLTITLACNTTVITYMYALTSDLVEDPRMAGTAFGILLLGGNLFGLCAPIVTGYIVKATGSFASAFALAAGLALIGAVIAMTMTRQPLRPLRMAAEAVRVKL